MELAMVLDSFLSVHEGPQAISRHNNVPLEPGMIISNEPGYYKKNSFGIPNREFNICKRVFKRQKS